MKFYNRESELKILGDLASQSQTVSRMTFIVGRRRIGKTALIKEAYKNASLIYLFVSKKNEVLLCSEFKDSIEAITGERIYGNFTRFSELFAYLIKLSREKPITLAIDEFQDFERVNSSIYSEMQNIWDANKNESKMNLILCGSLYSMMKKIFENKKEPLFGRADRKIHLKPFNVEVLKQIIKDNYPDASEEDILTFYMITGGIAKYVELLVNERVFAKDDVLNYVFSDHSLFLEEGKNLLIEEFGKEYGTYFSILSLLANSKTSRSEIESILEKDIGGYLDKLENEYSIIKKIKPVLAKPSSRVQKYFIDDNFLNFWFRYIYSYNSAIEIENFDLVKSIVKNDMRTYFGRLLEKYFKEKLSLSKEYGLIGSYWEAGNQNEIDIIALNELEKKVLIAEVKLNPEKISIPELKYKASKLKESFKKYKIQYKGFSLKDI
ncbi:MAG TPA: ATPase [Lentisphaeria bacterium]|nr:MAG: ATPase [Lentisphaerae bacterium GWF2_38_69]HBM17042.1 ATPase [Lentisphaeria bacterium]